ncbi:Tol-Pal system beta propeller repeat protein TolB [bacterium]|nr:Tol-Pal system beta propeller repeat protein TolB [bacterium]
MMFKRLFVSRPVIAVLGLLLATASHADLRIRIDGGAVGAKPIAIVPFVNNTGSQLDTDVTKVIGDDLQRSGLFEPLPEDAMIARPAGPGDVKFQNWRAVEVDHLVIGSVNVRPGGGHVVRFHLFDVYKAEQLIAFDVPTDSRSGGLRSAAHRVADYIYEEVTGIPGVFDTQIAYVTVEGKGPSRQFRLVVADADGYAPKTVVNSSEPLLSPAWSPDFRKLAYVAFEDGLTSIYVHELATGQAQKLVSKRGHNGAPSWSPDGREIVASLSHQGSADIYRVNVANGKLTRLTDSSAIDTEPDWSPDGSDILFTSDRGGKPQIYIIPASGGRATRVSFEGKSNSRGRYSADGKQIALVNYDDQGYRIGVLDLDSRQTNILSRGPLDESPSFAPNGAVLIYARQTANGGELATVTSDGRVRQRLSQTGSVREPAWSPYLK